MLHGKGVHPQADRPGLGEFALLREALLREDLLREALLRITNLSGGCSIADAKNIATTALDREHQAQPAD
jgi:hypothetical protein